MSLQEVQLCVLSAGFQGIWQRDRQIFYLLSRKFVTHYNLRKLKVFSKLANNFRQRKQRILQECSTFECSSLQNTIIHSKVDNIFRRKILFSNVILLLVHKHLWVLGISTKNFAFFHFQHVCTSPISEIFASTS